MNCMSVPTVLLLYEVTAAAVCVLEAPNDTAIPLIANLAFVNMCSSVILLLGLLILQVSPPKPVDRVARGSFDCYHPTPRNVSPSYCRMYKESCVLIVYMRNTCNYGSIIIQLTLKLVNYIYIGMALRLLQAASKN